MSTSPTPDTDDAAAEQATEVGAQVLTPGSAVRGTARGTAPELAADNTSSSTSDTSTGDPDPDLAVVLPRLVRDVRSHANRLTSLETQVEDAAAASDVLDALEEVAAVLRRAVTGGGQVSFLDGALTLGIGVGPHAQGDDEGGSGLAVSTERGAAAAPDAEVDESLDVRLLVEWVREHIALLIERKVPQTGGHPHWCRKWWLHPEAIARFEAVRRAWVEARNAGGGAMVIWFEHLDTQLAVLCSEHGPFAACTRLHTDRLLVLDQDDPTEDYFAAFERAVAAATP